MASCSYSRTVLKVASVFVLITFILQLVAVATPHWSYAEVSNNPDFGTVDTGLWQACTCKSHTDCDCNDINFTEDWFVATQALSVIGALALLVCMIITFVLLCTKQRRNVKISNIVILIIGGICILVALIIFGVKTDDAMDLNPAIKFDYSYILSIVAVCLLFLICLPFLIWDLCMTPKRLKEKRRRSVRRSDLYIQPEERYVVPQSYPAYDYQPSYQMVSYEKPRDYVVEYKEPARPAYTIARPEYVDYRSSQAQPMYADYRSSRPEYISPRPMEYSSYWR
ncbi:hypothetical protein ACF0H5_017283 [Mactra antiquata]